VPGRVAVPGAGLPRVFGMPGRRGGYTSGLLSQPPICFVNAARSVIGLGM
jgi:hypothetical protein